jgi:hypothetical protein
VSVSLVQDDNFCDTAGCEFLDDVLGQRLAGEG